jgi:uncharacterized pyridoxamine 5'-phosphate oxidase family protein
MNLNEELRKVGVYFLATVDGDKPAVRPFGASAEINGGTYICTGSSKAVYRQLAVNPHFEIAGMYEDGTWLRVSGVVHEEKDIEIKKLFLAANPFLAKIYGDHLETFVPLRLDVESIQKVE